MVRMPKLWNHSSSSVSAGGEQNAHQQRDVKQQIQRDGRAQHFGQIAGRDGDFAQNPKRQRTRRG